MKVLIKGAGVAGLALAQALLEAGNDLVVADLGGTPGMGASRYAGGMLAPFCEGETAPDDVVALGATAADWWERVLPGHVIRKGTLVLAPARDSGELARFAARTSAHRALDAGEIAALEPDLGGRFRQGLFFEGEAHLDPRKALAALAASLESRGVRFVLGSGTEETLSAEGPFDAEVDCRGAAALGGDGALRGVRGEMLLLATGDVTLSRPVRLLHPRIPLYVVPRGEGVFMVGATMIESQDDGPASVRSVMELLNAAYALHPAFAEARLLETGTGIRPAYADNRPRFEGGNGHFRLNGFYRHGFLLAPALAMQAARAIGGRP